MKTRAGKVLFCALALSIPVAGTAAPAGAQELSEKAVNSFMEYAWSLTPQQFSKPDGTTIKIDKTKRDENIVPVETAREVIKVGRLSAHAQVCNLQDEQTKNHHSMMRREEAKKKWTPQQLVYISQLHLTTVMLLTGKIRLVEKDGEGKVVFLDEDKKDEKPQQTCTPEQAAKVKEMIAAYVSASPQPAAGAAAPAKADAQPAAPAKDAAAAAAPAAPAAAAPAKAAATTTGSTAAAPAAAPAAAAPAKDAPAAAPAPKK